MRNLDLPMFDIGDLRNDPVSMYDLSIALWELDSHPAWDRSSECWKALHTVISSLWGNLPSVIVMDFRDPDDPETWGKWGPPPGIAPAALG